MKITIDVSGVDILNAKLRGLSEKKINVAIVSSLNQAARVSSEAVRKEIRSVFDRPTPWVVGGVQYTKAIREAVNVGGMMIGGASVMTATVDLDYWGNKQSVSVEQILSAQITGGRRHHKRHEVALQQAGILDPGYFIVPGQAAKLDQYGNMSSGEINKIIAWFRVSQGVGYGGKTTGKRKAALLRGTKKNNNTGFQYFVVNAGQKRTFTRSSGKSGSHKMQPGIYARYITGFGSAIRPIMIFVKAPNYRRRLDFYGVVNRAAEKDLDRVLPMYLKQLLAERGL